MRKPFVVCLVAAALLAGTDSKPRCTSAIPTPSYSDLARRAGVSGIVELSALIGKEGGVPESVAVVRSLGWGLDEAAIQAVSQWKFVPALSNSQPARFTVPVECQFDGPRTSNGYLSFGAMTFELPTGVRAPELTTFIAPDFYPDFRQKHERGKVQFSVNDQGEPENFEIEKPSSSNLEKAVLVALKQWRFQPAMAQRAAVSARGSLVYASTPK